MEKYRARKAERVGIGHHPQCAFQIDDYCGWAAVEIAGRTRPAAHRRCRFDVHLHCDRREHDSGVADSRAVLVCTARYWEHRGPDLWPATKLLFVHPAGMATPRR